MQQLNNSAYRKELREKTILATKKSLNEK